MRGWARDAAKSAAHIMVRQSLAENLSRYRNSRAFGQFMDLAEARVAIRMGLTNAKTASQKQDYEGIMSMSIADVVEDCWFRCYDLDEECPLFEEIFPDCDKKRPDVRSLRPRYVKEIPECGACCEASSVFVSEDGRIFLCRECFDVWFQLTGYRTEWLKFDLERNDLHLWTQGTAKDPTEQIEERTIHSVHEQLMQHGNATCSVAVKELLSWRERRSMSNKKKRERKRLPDLDEEAIWLNDYWLSTITAEPCLLVEPRDLQDSEVPTPLAKTVVPVKVKRNANCVRRKISFGTRVGGSSDCWKCIFQGQISDDQMVSVQSLREHIEFAKMLGDEPEKIWIRVCWRGPHLHFENPPGLPDGFEDQRKFVESNDMTALGCVRLTDFLENAQPGVMIGAPIVPESVKPQVPAFFDITLEISGWEKGKELVTRLAKWYWEHKTHEVLHPPAPLEPPPGFIPPPVLPPGVTPGDQLENFPHILTPIEELLAYFAHMGLAAGHAVKVAFDTIIDKLVAWGFHIDSPLQLLVLNLCDAVKKFGVATAVKAKYFLDAHGLSSFYSGLAHVGQFVSGFLLDALSLTANFLEWGMFGVKILNFLFQDFTEYHGPEHCYKRALVANALEFELVPERLLECTGDFHSFNLPTRVSPRLRSLLNDSTGFDSNAIAARPVVTAVERECLNAVAGIGNLPTIVLPENTPDSDLADYQACVPTFNVVKGVSNHPHPRPAGIRRYFRRVANDFLDGRGRPVRAVGASNTELPAIHRLVHNCWPNDSGRTNYRQKSFHTPLNLVHRAMTFNHKFEECDHGEGPGCVLGCDIWSFFSAHDIPPEDFMREMAKSASDTAVVALHLPFPLLDRRVKTYTDSLSGLHYEVKGDKLLVYHLDGHSAGYCHDLKTVIKWMSNPPCFENAHVQMECLAQVGTAVLLSVTIAEGAQEVTPSIWSCQRDPFYLLPELLHVDLADETSYFAVSARKFEQLTAYVATLEPTQLNNEYIIPKLRGMLAEIKIGVHTVEPRWSVTLPQLYSLVQHAIIAHQLFGGSVKICTNKLRKYYSRVRWRHGNFLQRFLQQRIDLVCYFRGEGDPMAKSGLFEFLTKNSYDHKHTFNPYQRAGTYRIAQLDVRYSDGTAPIGRIGKLCMTAVGGAWASYIKPSGVFLLQPIVSKFTNAESPEMTCEQLSTAVQHDEQVSEVEVNPAMIPLPESEDDDLREPPSDFIEETGSDLSDSEQAPNSSFFPPTSPPSSVSDSDDASSVHSVVAESVVEPDCGEWIESNMKMGNLRCLTDEQRSPHMPRKIDFLAPLVPVAREHPADDDFRMMLKGDKFIWPQSEVMVPMPSNGAAHLIDAAYLERPSGDYPVTFLPALGSKEGGSYKLRQLKRMFSANSGVPDADAAINAKVEIFVENLRPLLSSSHRVKILSVLGPAMCAKSSLARAYLTHTRRRALVYTPSRKLAKDWAEQPEINHLCQIRYRNQPPKLSRGPVKPTVGIIDEIFNWSPLEVGILLRLMSNAGVKLVLLLGDPSQKSAGCIQSGDPWLCRGIQLHTSLGMPRDAHYVFTRMNDLNPFYYTTTGSISESVFFYEQNDAPTDFKADLHFKMHQHSGGETDLTVGRIQGSRANNALFSYDMNTRNASWLNDTLSFKTVALTRHKERLLIHCNSPTRQNMAETKLYSYVGAKVDRDRLYSPLVVDDLVMPIKSQKLKKYGRELRAILSAPLALEGHCVVLEKPVKQAEEGVANVGFASSDLRSLVLENTNFELPEPAEIDFVTAQPKVSFSMGDPGPPVQRSDVRNGVENAHLLAAIHVNRSAHDSAKNLIDRQIATTKSARFDAKDVREGHLIYERFVECFCADKSTILDLETAATWLNDCEDAALLGVVSGQPLGATKSTLTCDAEFKTQTKAKAIAGFAATLPYGQSIIANRKVFNAHFAGEQPKAYLNFSRMMRAGVWLDYGMSDETLSNQILKTGVAHLMNGECNIQADVSKQDSSHTAGFLVAFLLLCRRAGLSEQICRFYLAYCQRYSFASRGADSVKASVSFNLGSGDPFTLIRNDIMELCVLACRFRHADQMFVVEKGDDVHGWIPSLAPHHLATLKSVAGVTLTVDYGSVGYHAGRFHNGTRYLVDPVRAFLKHFTRLSDENVKTSELYNSYISRATNYSESEVDFLIPACQAHYPHFSGDVIATMIQMMLKLRDEREFAAYSQLRVKDFSIAVDSRQNCIENCLRLMRPKWSKARLRSFRGLHINELKEKLRDAGVPFVMVDSHFDTLQTGIIALSSTHARVRVAAKDL